MWVTNILELPQCPPAKFQHWMEKPNNLGAALRRVCKTLSLKIIEQNLGLPLPDEIGILGLNNEDNTKDICYFRQIFLEGDGIPFSYARVVMPKIVYLHHLNEFTSLGNKLIGETLLYTNPKTVRSFFEYSQIDAKNPLFELIIASLPKTSTIPSSLWGRRSVFHLNGKEPILITEVFLEEIPIYMTD